MTQSTAFVVYMAILTWATIMLASLVRANAWTPRGFLLAMGNRDNLPPASALAGRLERTARNTLENFVLFAALVLVAHDAGANEARVALGAQIFFWARVVYVPVYGAGLAYIRTVVWAISIVGVGFIVAALL